MPKPVYLLGLKLKNRTGGSWGIEALDGGMFGMSETMRENCECILPPQNSNPLQAFPEVRVPGDCRFCQDDS